MKRDQAALAGGILLLSLLTFPVGSSADEPESPVTRAHRLASVRRFAYQLQKLDVEVAARSEADLMVIDPEGDGPRLAAESVARLRRKPDGAPRVVLAYLSIGEAEDYRPYWRKDWKRNPPDWLGPENPDWKGNFEVRYWMPGWQATILGTREAPLDRIVADGYDGVYLDIVDGFEYWEEHGRKEARGEMTAWVRRIAGHARESRPEFLVVPQNGEALGNEPGYLDLIDAIGREDLLFDGDKAQPREDVREAQRHLHRFRDAGKPVFRIEYCKKPANTERVYKSAGEQGDRVLVTVRPLDRWIVSPPPR